MFGKRILILIPHPDDEVVGCCGAILRAQAQGSKIFGAYLTTGIFSRKKEKEAALRREEAKAVAKLLNIHAVAFEEIPSRQLKDHLHEVEKKIAVTIKDCEIDQLWVPAYEGGHQDHDVTNFLASRLKKIVPVWEFSEYHFFGGKAQSNSFFESTGDEKKLELTTKESQIKKKALSLYTSQWFNLRVVRPSLTQEAFRPLGCYDYSKPPHEGKMYYQRFQLFTFHPAVDPIRPEELSLFFKKLSLPKAQATFFDFCR